MTDIKQYLKETNTVLLTKESFEQLKEKASVLDKIRDEIKETANKIRNIRSDNLCFFTEQDILEIIDKYIGGK